SGNFLHTITDPDSHVTTLNYDGSNNIDQIVDPLGNKTNIVYDGYNRVTSVTRVTNVVLSTGPTTSYSYQSPGGSCPSTATGQTVVTDPNGHDWTYCWDKELRVVRTIDPDSHQT